MPLTLDSQDYNICKIVENRVKSDIILVETFGVALLTLRNRFTGIKDVCIFEALLLAFRIARNFLAKASKAEE